MILSDAKNPRKNIHKVDILTMLADVNTDHEIRPLHISYSMVLRVEIANHAVTGHLGNDKEICGEICGEKDKVSERVIPLESRVASTDPVN
jgi:hypothetical protein